MKYLYKYLLADGGYYIIHTSANPILIKKHLSSFKKSVRDSGYLDSGKFVNYLEKRGIKAERVKVTPLKGW